MEITEEGLARLQKAIGVISEFPIASDDVTENDVENLTLALVGVQAIVNASGPPKDYHLEELADKAKAAIEDLVDHVAADAATRAALAIADDLNGRKDMGLHEIDSETVREILKTWARLIRDIHAEGGE